MSANASHNSIRQGQEDHPALSHTTTNTPADQAQKRQVDVHGNVVTSNDPTTRDDAKITAKLAGDVKGAVSGTVGSIESAVGTTIGNKGLQSEGLRKMEEEDARLTAKRGVPPVGSDVRK